jgi:CheY-like chemotaxis protein
VNGGTNSVLIVDDEPDSRESLGEFFQDEGFQVVTVANGADALAQLKAGTRPDVIILDLMMPLLSGRELYDRMQADPALASIPVIITTSDPSGAPSGLLIMKKPMNLTRLLTTVRQYCTQSA